MRIVLDAQACQSGNRLRGIGRFSLELARAMINYGERHEFVLALNGAHADGARELTLEFAGQISLHNIHIWPSLSFSRHWRQRQNSEEQRRFFAWFACEAKILRQRSIAALKPDVVHVMSQFETVDAVPASNDDPFPFVATHYDLIPFIYPENYLRDEWTRRWFRDRLSVLKNAEFLLTISEYSRLEVIEHLGLEAERVINVSAAADQRFVPIDLSEAQRIDLLGRYGIFQEFLLYTGGYDSRKNLPALIRAYATLPAAVRSNHMIVCAGFIDSQQEKQLLNLARCVGLRRKDLLFTGYIPDTDLVGLYNTCKLFVFPSLHEGFGLPVLEAMACGAPVIASNTTSMPEVVGNKQVLFDPSNENSITRKLIQVLTDVSFRDFIAQQGLRQSKRFSWETTARFALEAFECWYKKRNLEHKRQ